MNLSETLYSFYDHNGPLIFFGSMSIICMLLSLRRGGTYYTWMFLAFLILTFRFEYDKHLFSKIKTDMLDLIFPPSTRYTKYDLVRTFLELYFPILLDITGWGIIALNFIRGKRGS